MQQLNGGLEEVKDACEADVSEDFYIGTPKLSDKARTIILK